MITGPHPHAIEAKRREAWIRNRTVKLVSASNLYGKTHTNAPSVGYIWANAASIFGVLEPNMGYTTTFWIGKAAREITMALAYRFTDLTAQQIADACGRRCATQVERACAKHDAMLDEITTVRRRNPSAISVMSSTDLRVLRRLKVWSIDGEFASVEDIMPDMKPATAAIRLGMLRSQGLAESDGVGFRISAAGRAVFKESTQ